MRNIKIEQWKAKDQKGEDTDEDLISAMNVLILNRRPDQMPRGLDNFRIFGRVANAFDKAKETKVLKLEEQEYMFLKKMIETDIPSIWGSNKNITKAVESFLDAKQE